MAAKMFAFLALLALAVSAATSFTIPRFYSPSDVPTVATIPQFFPLVTVMDSAYLFLQSYRQQQAFMGAISPLSAMISRQPLAISQFPYLYNQLNVPLTPHTQPNCHPATTVCIQPATSTNLSSRSCNTCTTRYHTYLTNEPQL